MEVPLGGGLRGEPDKVLHIKGKNDSALTERKGSLIRIGMAQIAGFLGGETIDAAVSKNLDEERINIFI